MNQILDGKTSVNKKIKVLFIIQFYISFIFIIVLFLYWLNINKNEKENEYLSNIINSNAKLNSIFNSKEDNIYFGKIVIDKINLDYFIYNDCTEELLKILPCKYSGPALGEEGNICILGHNYLNGIFFSDIDKLENNDEIIIEGMGDKKYKYKVYEKLEIDESNAQDIINPKQSGSILTLCTCTVDRDIRLIVRAKLKQKL